MGRRALLGAPGRPVMWWGALGWEVTVAVVTVLGVAVLPASPASRSVHATAVAAPAETAAPVPYPYETATRVGPWGFSTRHATDYVAWRFFERDVAFTSTMSGPNGRTGRFADPGTWAASATAMGFRVDSVARPGSVAHWNAGEDAAKGAGHVAYVERVNPDGSVVVSEFDRSVPFGYSQRGQAGTSPVRAPRYIHVQDL